MLKKELALPMDVMLNETLIKQGANLEIKDKFGRTVIYDAIVKGLDHIVRLLCTSNAKINIQDKEGKTPLHFAAVHNRLEIARVLIQYGAVVDAKDENGNTPLSDAVFYSQGVADIIQLLLDHGADCNLKNNYDVSPKDLAGSISNFDVSYLFK